MNDKGKELCPRLIDFIVIVGRRPNAKLYPHGTHHKPTVVNSTTTKKFSRSAYVTNPELLRRYPKDNHKDFELPTDVTYFCQPEGCIVIGKKLVYFYIPIGQQKVTNFDF